jgi:transcriptional regulator with GAF, ATPase, and Fis domain
VSARISPRDRDKRGWFDRAEDGTIFLDEVGEMSLRMQALLLRCVETGELQRVGAERIHTVNNVRIVAATNRNLLERVAEKELPRRTLSDEALAQLMAYRWPGNVRELSNILERIVVCNRASVISAADVSFAGFAQSTAPSKPGHRETTDLLYERMVNAGESFSSVVHSPFASHDLTRADLRALVARGLEQTRGNYRSLLMLFNASEHDYKRFLNFLTKHGCRLSYQEFRSVPLSRASLGNGAASSATPKSC